MNEDKFAAIGCILAKLHSLDSPMLKTVSREDRLAEIEKKSAKLAQAFPALEKSFQQLSQRMHTELAALPPLNPVVIHGDVHIGQFMLTADNTLAILDFDGCCKGDPTQDLADMIVDPHLSNFERANTLYAEHNRLLPAEFATQLLAGYREHARYQVDNTAIIWNGRLQLINKAYRAAITQEIDWFIKIPELIMLATSDDLLNYSLE